MSLSSLFFALCFLPIVTITYFLTPVAGYKNRLLIFFSLLFYSFGGVGYLVLLMVMTAIGWFAALKIEAVNDKGAKKRWLVSSVVIFVLVLGVFKYTNFLVGTVTGFAGIEWKPLAIALPIGISFYTFKLISYVADVYMGKCVAEEYYWVLLLYTSIFPQALQGPIERFSDIKAEIYNRETKVSDVSEGIYRFCIGLAKKTVLADHIGELAATLSPVSEAVSGATTLAVWLGSLCYAMQLYLDFSAYTDMAIGAGRIFGFRFPENFNYPYAATSVKDFWRRWHITLSSFFKDYVYIPLGGNRVGLLKTSFNLLVVWMLTGLWHGASWNFVLWGLFYLPFIVVENWWKKKELPVLPRFFRHILAIFILNFGWLLFRYSDINQLFDVISIYLGIRNNGFIVSTVNINIQNNIFLLIVCVLACTPLFLVIDKKLKEKSEQGTVSVGLLHSIKILICIALLGLSLIAMAGNSFTPFLYNQF